VAFTVLYNACVLYSQPLRDLLMHLASTDLFRARWSEQIHAEWMRAVLRDRPELADRLRRTRRLMDDAVPDCLVTGHEALAEHLDLPDPADVIVTRNLRDFPRDALDRYRIDAQHPDVFLRHVLDLEGACLAAIRSLRNAMNKPCMTAAEYLDLLARQELPETVAFLRQRIDIF